MTLVTESIAAQRPRYAFFRILDHVGGHFVVGHADLRPVAVRAELRHVAAYVLASIAVVDFEVEGAVTDDGEKDIAPVQAHRSKHAA